MMKNKVERDRGLNEVMLGNLQVFGTYLLAKLAKKLDEEMGRIRWDLIHKL